MGNPIKTDADGRRGDIVYAIPSTSLSLHLTLGLDLPLPIATIRACLTGAMETARSYNPKSLTPSDAPWRYPDSVENTADNAEISSSVISKSGGDVVMGRFGIVGDPVFGTNDLTWGDVKDALRGLESWIEEEGREVEVWFRLVEDEKGGRGEVGSGSLRRRGAE
ncbi:MAG: hypothetical protein ASARMPRED_009286 [Alectoria sarmentosa]|nr:MAG: hypothetical protein ASARMPRED_009286 [Alectoria sarmentosa]